jgi:hypothetical protein
MVVVVQSHLHHGSIKPPQNDHPFIARGRKGGTAVYYSWDGTGSKGNDSHEMLKSLGNIARAEWV